MILGLFATGLLCAQIARQPQVRGDVNPASWSEDLEKSLQKYRTASYVHIKLEKRVHQALLERTLISKGYLKLSRGKLRMEITEPDTSLLVFDGRYAWMEQSFDLGDAKQVQVTKVRVRDRVVQASWLAVLFGDSKGLENFELVQKTDEGEVSRMILKPKSQQDSDIVRIQVSLAAKNRHIESLQVWDSLDNRTEYILSQANWSKQLPKGEFTYKPPKGATVTTL